MNKKHLTIFVMLAAASSIALGVIAYKAASAQLPPCQDGQPVRLGDGTDFGVCCHREERDGGKLLYRQSKWR